MLYDLTSLAGTLCGVKKKMSIEQYVFLACLIVSTVDQDPLSK